MVTFDIKEEIFSVARKSFMKKICVAILKSKFFTQILKLDFSLSKDLRQHPD
jgi:hypothetical protein